MIGAGLVAIASSSGNGGSAEGSMFDILASEHFLTSVVLSSDGSVDWDRVAGLHDVKLLLQVSGSSELDCLVRYDNISFELEFYTFVMSGSHSAPYSETRPL